MSGDQLKSRFSRRLAEIEKELSYVKHDLRTASKAVRKQRGGVPVPPSRVVVSAAPAEAAPPAPDGRTRKQSPDDLFGLASGEAAASAPDAVAAADQARSGGRQDNVLRDERVASYFMSGNLGNSGPQLRRERRIQRNKAIVMLVFVALVLVVVLALILR